MKVIVCKHCGKIAARLVIGRKPTNLNVIKVCDTLRACRSIPLAAENLKCSRGLIYKILKNNGMTPAEVLRSI